MSITVMPVIERSRMPNSMIYTSVSMKNVELKIVIMLRHLSLLNFTITWWGQSLYCVECFTWL